MGETPSPGQRLTTIALVYGFNEFDRDHKLAAVKCEKANGLGVTVKQAGHGAVFEYLANGIGQDWGN